MNKEYILKDGKALIIDDTNNDETIKYYDNLDNVLIKENLIETIEESIKSLEKKESKLTNDINYQKKQRKYTIYFSLSLSIILTILVSILGGNITLIERIISTLTLSGMVVVPSCFIVAGLVYIIDTFEINKLIHQKTGVNSQLKFLKKELAKEIELKDKLKMDLSCTNNTINLKRIKVNDIEALKELREKVLQYYHIGYNKKKFNKYYQNNELEEIVDKEDIELVKEILEEKGPILAKKKK